MSQSARSTLFAVCLLSVLLLTGPGQVSAQVASGGLAGDVQATNVTGMAVQGISVDLEYFRGDKNVLLVFYRMYN